MLSKQSSGDYLYATVSTRSSRTSLQSDSSQGSQGSHGVSSTTQQTIPCLVAVHLSEACLVSSLRRRSPRSRTGRHPGDERSPAAGRQCGSRRWAETWAGSSLLCGALAPRRAGLETVWPGTEWRPGWMTTLTLPGTTFYAELQRKIL